MEKYFRSVCGRPEIARTPISSLEELVEGDEPIYSTVNISSFSGILSFILDVCVL